MPAVEKDISGPPADPCGGQAETHIVAWYVQGGVRYPLRCGCGRRRGGLYIHVRDATDVQMNRLDERLNKLRVPTLLILDEGGAGS
jgi:hypothetical protein